MAKEPPATTAARTRAQHQPRYHTSGRFAAAPHVRAAPVARPAPAPLTLAKVAPGIAKATGAAKAAK